MRATYMADWMANAICESDMKQDGGIKEIRNYLAEIETEQSKVYNYLSDEELKKKLLEWECYQFFDLFRLANMDWKPTREMLDAVKGKRIPKRFEIQTVPPFEEFIRDPSFEVYWLKDLYN